MITEAERKEIIEYVEILNLLPENKNELLELLEKNEYDILFAKLEVYTELENRKETELKSLQSKLDEQKLKEYRQEDKQDSDNYADVSVKLENLQNELNDLEIEKYYQEINKKIDVINEKTLKKIADLKQKIVKDGESHQIEEVRNKLE